MITRNIGDTVWIGSWNSMSPSYIECPHCMGTGRLLVIFADDTEVSIECKNCSVGWDPPSGRIQVYEGAAYASQDTITGLVMENGELIYRLQKNYERNSNEVFDSESDAVSYAISKLEKQKQKQIEQIQKKEKDTRSWAWNASYHRNEIKRSQKNIEYHSAKLAVASLKAKEDKVNAN